MNIRAYSKNDNKNSLVKYLTIDGWTITEDGTYGDNGSDCVIKWDNQKEFLKSVRAKYRLTQANMSWILGVSRPTYIRLEQGKTDLTVKDYIILNNLKFGIEEE